MVKIPTPKYVVIYNGNKEIDDVTTLRLSDAFEIPDETKSFEWTATVINVNKNHNSNLLKTCKSLYYYSSYVDKVRANIDNGMNKDEAINTAVQYAIKHNFLDGFFRKQKMEVLNMSFTEFDQEEYDRNRRAEGIAIGRNEGIEIGEQRGEARGIEIGQQEKALETARNLLSLKLLTDEQIATTIGISLEQVALLKQ